MTKRHTSILNRKLNRSNTVGKLAIFMASFLLDQFLLASTAGFKAKEEAEGLAKQKIAQIFNKYCSDSCELISVTASTNEESGEIDDIGFESIVGEQTTRVQISHLMVEAQVDSSVGAADRERLQKLVITGLKSLAPIVDMQWHAVSIPQIGVTSEVEDRLRLQIQQKLHATVETVLNSYCPEECALGSIVVEGRLVSSDESRGLNERELVRDRGSKGILRIENIDIEVSMDSKLSDVNRKKIYELLKARTKFAFPVHINVTHVDFPEASQSKAAQERDPWGLDRLRQTLQIFRDLASTKEIITNSNSTSQSSHESQSSNSSEKSETRDSRESLNSKESLQSKEGKTEIANNNSETSQSSKSDSGENYQYALYIGAFLLLAGIIVTLIIRFGAAAKDAKVMLETAANGAGGEWKVPQGQSAAGMRQDPMGSGQPTLVGPNVSVVGSGAVSAEKLSLKIKIEGLKEELMRVFMDNPKVARDVFTRMLQEDGVEVTSKYVHIFGQMVVFEIMNDPSLQRDIYDLSEFYHKSSFHFADEQLFELLAALKTKITASEIKLLTRKRAEQFDFLQNLDAPQVFMLLNDERAQVQSIVLTQLDHQRRRAVFDMYEGASKVALMRELCRADAIPKEYLSNVAKALHKKVLSKNEFDTEQLRSNDILFDLLEKATLQDQRALMADLVRSNPAAARAIKLKLVTVEMLPYLKDGHLLELVMGLEREDLLAFLVGTPDHIRDLLLSKAPHELSQSWIEDIEQMTGVDEATYRLAELKIINRLRTLANNGAIRLLDINDRIFADEALASIRRKTDDTVDMSLSRNSMAA
jgi:flagellar motor switch protein FliG